MTMEDAFERSDEKRSLEEARSRGYSNGSKEEVNLRLWRDAQNPLNDYAQEYERARNSAREKRKE